jgi:hypothetical protein
MRSRLWGIGLCALLSACFVVEEEPGEAPLQGEQSVGGEEPPPPTVAADPNQQQPAPPVVASQPVQVQPIQPSPMQLTPLQPVQPNPVQPGQPAVPAGTAAIDVSCAFEQGFVTVLPLSVYQRGDEFVMQALIGFSTDASFWSGQNEYQHLRPYAAQQCLPTARRFQVQPGRYVVLVGWAGRFQVAGSYARNGRIEHVSVAPGQALSFAVTPAMLNHEFVCISCPYLAVRRDGRAVELGQVLVDRYTAARAGTDVRTTTLDVRGGRVVVTLHEREPEVSRLDAVEVRVDGRVLPLAAGAPPALRAIDGQRHSLSMGESLDVPFDAAGIPDGTVTAEIRVTGHYDPIGPLL